MFLFNAKPRWFEVADYTYVIAGGLDEWVPTDISSSSIPAGALAVFTVVPSGNQDAGVRKRNSTIDCFRAVANGVPTFAGLAYVSSAFQVELRRDLAQNVYHLCGWWV